MSSSIDRLENLIRVLRTVAPGDLDMSNWCKCAVGHARRDQYFIDEGMLHIDFESFPLASVAEFFGLDSMQSYSTFFALGYNGHAALGRLAASAEMPTPADVIARLQVLLLEKRLQREVFIAGKIGNAMEAQLASSERELEPA